MDRIWLVWYFQLFHESAGAARLGTYHVYALDPLQKACWYVPMGCVRAEPRAAELRLRCVRTYSRFSRLVAHRLATESAPACSKIMRMSCSGSRCCARNAMASGDCELAREKWGSRLVWVKPDPAPGELNHALGGGHAMDPAITNKSNHQTLPFLSDPLSWFFREAPTAPLTQRNEL